MIKNNSAIRLRNHYPLCLVAIQSNVYKYIILFFHERKKNYLFKLNVGGLGMLVEQKSRCIHGAAGGNAVVPSLAPQSGEILATEL